jgi:hypothetical protein
MPAPPDTAIADPTHRRLVPLVEDEIELLAEISAFLRRRGHDVPPKPFSLLELTRAVATDLRPGGVADETRQRSASRPRKRSIVVISDSRPPTPTTRYNQHWRFPHHNNLQECISCANIYSTGSALVL